MKIFTEEVVFDGPVRFNITPTSLLDKLVGTTPLVKNGTVFICNGVAVTIVNFIGGASCQTIRILGDGVTTVANNSIIKTNTTANKLLLSDKVYVFTLINNIWYEDA